MIHFTENSRQNVAVADTFGIDTDTGLGWIARDGHRAYIIHDDSGRHSAVWDIRPKISWTRPGIITRPGWSEVGDRGGGGPHMGAVPAEGSEKGNF